MGRVRTKTVKKASRLIVEKYYTKLSTDFQQNKRVVDEIALVPSKRLRNKIAGFTTHLMKRINTNISKPVRGISLKLQEEERERKDNYVPEVSAVKTDAIEIDQDTKNMLRLLDMSNLPGVNVVQIGGPQQHSERRGPRREGRERRD